MEHKQKVDLIIALCLLVIGLAMIVLPLLGVNNIKNILVSVFSLYTLLNLIQFILTRESKDYESLFTFIVSTVTTILIMKYKVNTPRTLALILMFWLSGMSLLKLKKIDYYHDRRDRMWKIKTFTLVLFIITGLAAIINLAYTRDIQIIVIGFFFIIHAILELFDPITKTLIKHG